MSWLSKAVRKIRRGVKKVAAPLGVAAAFAVPGGGILERVVRGMGRVAGGIKAKADGVSSAVEGMAGGLAQGAAEGYAHTAATTRNPFTGDSLAEEKGRKWFLLAAGAAALVVVPKLLNNNNNRRRY